MPVSGPPVNRPPLRHGAARPNLLAMLRYAVICVLGVLLGIASAAAAISTLGARGALTSGPWQTPLDAGGPGRGPYPRAAAALRATLALSRREALYFRATTDSAGAPLRGACTYRVHGPAMPARWWSLTLYDAAHNLIAAAPNRTSIASATATRAADGGFSVLISPRAQAGDWLDTANAPGLVLLTRLYQPGAAAAAAPRSIPLPAIDRLSCP